MCTLDHREGICSYYDVTAHKLRFKMADTQRPRLTRLLGQLNNLIVAQQSLCLQWRGWECHLFGWMKIKRNMEAFILHGQDLPRPSCLLQAPFHLWMFMSLWVTALAHWWRLKYCEIDVGLPILTGKSYRLLTLDAESLLLKTLSPAQMVNKVIYFYY